MSELEDTASHLRRQYHRAIRDAKRRHWKEFLNNTDNIWKAARYLEPGNRSIGMVSALSIEGRTIDDDHGKAHALLEAFFPPLPSILDGPHEEPQQLAALPMETINSHEIEAALLKMASWKAPGPDGLPVVVWQRIWPIVKHWVVKIFQASLRLSYFPAVWRSLRGRQDVFYPLHMKPAATPAARGSIIRGLCGCRPNA